MKYIDMFNRVKGLEFDTDVPVCKANDAELYLRRPSVLTKRFSNYNVKKNFQIWLKEDKRNFRPNHLRVFIDLNLRVRGRPDLKKELLIAFDNIFYGKDPNEAISSLRKESFEHFLNPIEIISNLSQLFIIEQAYSYNKESKFEPPTLFYQGWIRQVLDDIKEIDNICMSIASGQPPAAKYTSRENRKNKKFQTNLKPLWYLDE